MYQETFCCSCSSFFCFAPRLNARRNEKSFAIHSPAGSQPARLCPRGAAEDQRTHQAQHEREPVSAFTHGVAGSEGGGGRAVAALPESDDSAAEGEAREVSRVQAGEHHCRQWL